MRARLQSAIRLLYPPQCLVCGQETAQEFALCARCWAKTPFITGTICDKCGTPLPGDSHEEGALCDACTAEPPPWSRGRVAWLYQENGRRLVLMLKNGDRHDLATPMASWMLACLGGAIPDNTIIAPVPLNRWRFFGRRFNQAALLAQALAEACGQGSEPDLLVRPRYTKKQKHATRAERMANLQGAFHVSEKWGQRIVGREVLLVDDVLTTGATLSAAADACLTAGARKVDIVTLARVARDT